MGFIAWIREKKEQRRIAALQRNKPWVYRQTYIRCGKPGCHCATSVGHGPYWYADQHVAGRTRTRYIGKVLPSDVRHDD